MFFANVLVDTHGGQIKLIVEYAQSVKKVSLEPNIQHVLHAVVQVTLKPIRRVRRAMEPEESLTLIMFPARIALEQGKLMR